MKQNFFIVVCTVCSIIMGLCFESYSQQEGTMTDVRDNQSYKTIILGNQIWMAENLNYNTSSGSWCYNNDSNYCQKFGRLYNWETSMNACPSGWHIPSKTEWDTLVRFLGGQEVAGAKLKSLSNWNTKHDSISNYAHVAECGHKHEGIVHDSILINSSNFNGLPGGGFYTNSVFDYMGEFGIWWTSTGYNEYSSFYFSLIDTSTETGTIYHALNSTGFSVRCLKNK